MGRPRQRGIDRRPDRAGRAPGITSATSATAHSAPLEQVTPKPSLAALSGGRQQLLDLAGEGHLDLVQYDGPMAGFHERTLRRRLGRFHAVQVLPNINTKDPNLRFVDITGDGHPDILISEDTVFTWYESLAKDGFAPATRSPKSWDEEKGPRLVFSDPTQSIFLADMVGDGLSDIVRIRYGEVCYWPNLGYGRFGAKVTMGNAPVFESPDLFDPRRIHLADIDGSGNSDIIYVGHDGISLYFNQSGNFWSPPHRLSHFPRVDSLTSIAAMDLLGNGTACLVWSSPLALGRAPAHALHRPHGRAEAAPPRLHDEQHGRGDRGSVHGLHEILSAGPPGRPSVGDEAAVSRPRHRAGREPRSRLQHQARQHLSLSSRLLRRRRARVPRVRLCRTEDAESVVGRIRPAAGRDQDLVPQRRLSRRRQARGLFQGPGQPGIFLPATRRRAFLPDTDASARPHVSTKCARRRAP